MDMVGGKTGQRGVAPVVSTILLVAIVVILTAVVSTFVLGMGESVSEPAPTALIEVDQEGGMILAVHSGGETIEGERLAARGGNITDAPETVTAGDAVRIVPDSGAETVWLVWEGEQNSATLTRASGLTAGGDPSPLVANTNATAPVSTIVEFEEDHSEEQYNELEALNLSDPFTLAVEAPELAGEESTDYAITAYYDEFGESPRDRLAGPSTPLKFDEDGIANVTIGSAGTDADVTTWIAPGSLSDDASLTNIIEVPEETERIAVETEDEEE